MSQHEQKYYICIATEDDCKLNRMGCIFLGLHKSCRANLPHYSVSSSQVDDETQVDEGTLKKYCVKEEFSDCPRFKAYMEYLEKEQ